VAYRQPVSRSRVSAVRGVNCDAVMRTLTLRGLVEEAGTEHETGAILYRTTGYFLERLGLASLDELPELAPFLPDHIEDAADQVGEAPDHMRPATDEAGGAPDHVEAATGQAGEAPDQIEAATGQAGEASDHIEAAADQAGEAPEQMEEARDPRDDQGS